MRSRALQQILATIANRPIGDVDTRTRVLRALNEVGSGPRGPAALHMSAAEWTFHLLALVAPKVPDVERVMKALRDCRHRPNAATKDLFETADDVSITTLVAYAIEHGLNWMGNVEIDDSGRFAWVNVHRREGKVERMFFAVDPAVDGEAVDWATVGNRFVIGGAAIRYLHKAFTEDAASNGEQPRKAG
jgi:hypothetical protein